MNSMRSHNIQNHFFRWSREDAAAYIADMYEKWKPVFVDFLYFASAMKMRLFEEKTTQAQQQYASALADADILLPDGIALQIFDRCNNIRNPEKHRIKNLNWTDFTPYLLEYLLAKWSVSIYVRTVYDEKIGKDKSRMHKWVENLQKKFAGLRCPFSRQCSYHERGSFFPEQELAEARKNDDAKYKLFWNCIGTPFQEIRAHTHKEIFDTVPCIVLQLGGTLDFRSGYEQRAPDWVVKARVLETPRRILKNPQKNLKKFLAMFGIVRYLLQKIFPRKK